MFTLDFPILRLGLREGLSSVDAIKDRSALFDQLDTNNSNKLNQAEFIKGMMRANPHMSQTVAKELFSKLDMDRINGVTRDEFEGLYLFINQEQFRGHNLFDGQGSLDDILTKTIKQYFAMDRNHDGILSGPELNGQPPEFLSENDLNEDGKVEVAEVIANIESHLPLDNDQENNRLHGISSHTIAEINKEYDSLPRDPLADMLNRTEFIAYRLSDIMNPHGIEIRDQVPSLVNVLRDGKRLFDYVDTNRNGIISQLQLKGGLQNLFGYSEQDASKLASEIFKAGNDGGIYLTKDEFTSGYVNVKYIKEVNKHLDNTTITPFQSVSLGDVDRLLFGTHDETRVLSREDIQERYDRLERYDRTTGVNSENFLENILRFYDQIAASDTNAGLSYADLKTLVRKNHNYSLDKQDFKILLGKEAPPPPPPPPPPFSVGIDPGANGGVRFTENIFTENGINHDFDRVNKANMRWAFEDFYVNIKPNSGAVDFFKTVHDNFDLVDTSGNGLLEPTELTYVASLAGDPTKLEPEDFEALRTV